MTPAQRAEAERIIKALQNLGNEEEDAAALLRELLAEPEEEPAWWVCVSGHGNGLRRDRPPKDIIQFWTPVYTRPQRQPLTPFERRGLWKAWHDTPGSTGDDLIVSVERTHGIGEKT